MSKKRSRKRMNVTSNAGLNSQPTMQITIAPVAPRNPYANHPLMRKSTVHEKPKSAERSKTRRETKQLARDWSNLNLTTLFSSK